MAPCEEPAVDAERIGISALPPVEQVVQAFRQGGLLIHMTTCSGWKCGLNPNAFRWLDDAMQSAQLPLPLERDCGEWCSAFTFLGPTTPLCTFSFGDYYSGIGLLYPASSRVWRQMQCAAVTDSTSVTRACCACQDPLLCPWQGFEPHDSGYCNAPCSSGSETCKQLAAGCGASVWDVSEYSFWGDQTCDRSEIQNGECDLCREPLWCDDPSGFGYNGTIRTPQDWMDHFYQKDKPPYVSHNGVRQCKWKRSHKQLFIDTMRTRFVQRQRDNLQDWNSGTLWNEVNAYVGPGDGDIERTMWDSLLGLVYVRNTGDDKDLSRMRDLAAHIKSLGKDVPMFAVNAGMDCLFWWDSSQDIDLLSPPYNFEQIT